MKFTYSLLCLFILITSCSNNRDYIITEKDIIPEGTAFNSQTNTIYIGCIYKQKILAISPDKKIKDVIPQKTFGNLSPIGMEVDNERKIL